MDRHRKTGNAASSKNSSSFHVSTVYLWRARRPRFGKYVKRKSQLSPPVSRCQPAPALQPAAALEPVHSFLNAKEQGKKTAKSLEYSHAQRSQSTIGKPIDPTYRVATQNDRTTNVYVLHRSTTSTQPSQIRPQTRSPIPARPPTPSPVPSNSTASSFPSPSGRPVAKHHNSPSAVSCPVKTISNAESTSREAKEKQPVAKQYPESSYQDIFPSRKPPAQWKPRTFEGQPSAPKASVGPTNPLNAAPTESSKPISKRSGSTLPPSSGYYLSIREREELARERRAEGEVKDYWELMRYD
jgi:hypothetical protein